MEIPDTMEGILIDLTPAVLQAIVHSASWVDIHYNTIGEVERVTKNNTRGFTTIVIKDDVVQKEPTPYL